MSVVTLIRGNQQEADPRSSTTYRVCPGAAWHFFEEIERNARKHGGWVLALALAALWVGVLAFFAAAFILAAIFIVLPAYLARQPYMDIGPTTLFFSEGSRTIPYMGIRNLEAYRSRKFTGDEIVGRQGNETYLRKGQWVPDPKGAVYMFRVWPTEGNPELIDYRLFHGLDAPTILQLIAERAAITRGVPAWNELVTYTDESRKV